MMMQDTRYSSLTTFEAISRCEHFQTKEMRLKVSEDVCLSAFHVLFWCLQFIYTCTHIYVDIDIYMMIASGK